MSELKLGDRVKVEFEGTVQDEFDGEVGIKFDTGDYRVIDTIHCTLIEPEIVLPEVPGTIVQVDPLNEQGERAAFELQVDLWFESGGDAFSTLELTEQCRQYGYRVIPAAEAEGVSE